MKFDYKEYIPKSLICLWEGYTSQIILNDTLAGISVGILALPLAMAFAIGSGLPPEQGLFTAIVAGFLISLLGGSRVQIGGPAGAFVVIVYSIIQRHGYDGLAIATLLAGVMMIFMGIARFGILLKFVPYPVTTGFLTGIAVIIFSSQVKDFLGLDIKTVPADFIAQWHLYLHSLSSWNPWAFFIALTSMSTIFALRKFYPKIPGAIIAVILTTSIAGIFNLPVETIGTKFGEIPNLLPWPTLPSFSFEKVQAVFPDALTIALLGAIESLLSASVADGMTGQKHRSNCELVAQGIANVGSILFGGMPATGAIARTTMNIKMHAKTPLSGMVHALTLLLLMICFAPFAKLIPLASLAGVLFFVAWNMCEFENVIDILKGPKSDIAVLVITFFATILIDLTVAVQLGVILAALLFIKRISDNTTGKAFSLLLKEDENQQPEIHDSNILFRKDVPEGVTVFEIDGPFFFAVADLLNDTLKQIDNTTKIFILRMSKVPIIDASGLNALKKFKKRCNQKGILFLISGVREDVKPIIKNSSLEEEVGPEHFFPNVNFALEYARTII